MRILIIGGTGFIGRFVTRSLASAGHDVSVLHRGKRPLEGIPGVKEIIGDRSQLADLAQPTDVVLDMICSTEAAATSVVDAFRGLAGRFVMVSSADVYRAHDVMHGKDAGPAQPIPIYEDDALRSTRYPYRGVRFDMFDWVSDDYDKILAENALRSAAGDSATILRLPMVYGPGDPLHRFLPYLKQMDAGAPAVQLEAPMADWRGCWGFVENVADAVALACTHENAAGRIYNVADPEPLPFSRWIRDLGQAVGWTGSLDLTVAANPHFRYEQNWHTDSTRIRKELGYSERVPRLEALRRTVAWERQ